MAISEVVDPVFGIDNFNKPKTLNESQTLVNNILMLLFMKPGTYPSLPKLGIYIQQYLYMFFDEINVDVIKAKIAAQCEEFLPNIQDGTLDVLKTTKDGKPVLLVVLPVRIDDELTGLVIGTTIDSIGKLIYNYQFDKNAIA